jgi:hypothetical protein
MIKRSDATAAVRPGPAVPFRLTFLVVSAVLPGLQACNVILGSDRHQQLLG